MISAEPVRRQAGLASESREQEQEIALVRVGGVCSPRLVRDGTATARSDDMAHRSFTLAAGGVEGVAIRS